MCSPWCGWPTRAPRSAWPLAARGHLRSLEALALYPANSLFVEGYLTTRGRGSTDTYRMIRDAGCVIERADGSIASWAEFGLDDQFRVDGEEQIMKADVLAQLPGG